MDWWRNSWIFIWIKFSLPEIFRNKQRHKGDFHLERFLNSSCNLMCVCVCVCVCIYLFTFIYTQEHVGKSRNTCIKWKTERSRREPDMRRCLEAELLLRAWVRSWADRLLLPKRDATWWSELTLWKATTKFLSFILAHWWKYG